MNKFLSAFCAENGIDCEKTNFYGELKGFQVSGTVVGSNITVAVNVHIDEAERTQIADWLGGNKRTYSLNQFSVDENGFYSVIYAFNAPKKCVAYLENAIEYLVSFKQPHCCPFCGNELSEDKRLVGIGANKMYAHEKCFDEYCERVRNNEIQTASAPNNYLKGTLGALAGCLVGAILYVIFYSIVGVISWICALIGSLLAAFLWDKFGGKNDKIKIIIIWVITIVLITIAMFISYLIVVNTELAKEGLEGESTFEWFKLLLQIDEFRLAVIRDTVLSYVLLIVGNVWTTINLIRSQKLVSNSLNKY